MRLSSFAVAIALATILASANLADFARAETAIVTEDSESRFDFVLNCSGCHGTDARGSATVPALDETGALVASAAGREYLVRVPGVAQSPISDERLARLMNFVLTEFGGASGFPPYTSAEVAALRADPLRSPLSARPKK